MSDLPILAYHKIDLQRELGITSLSPQKFEKQIKFLKQEGYIDTSPQFLINYNNLYCLNNNESILAIKGGGSISQIEPDKLVMITFDDGYEGVYNFAYPILKEYGFTALIFLTAGYIGKQNSWDASPGPRFRHLSWSQIREMADNGIWFGSHGINHTFLTKQSNKSAKNEIETSKNILENILSLPVYFFSYPYGNYDDRIINLVMEAGYKAAFSLRPESFINYYDPYYRYALPRIAIYLIDSMWAFKAKIGDTKVSNLLCYMERMKNRLINRCSYASMLVKD